MGTFDTLAKIIMDDDSEIMIALELYEEEQLDRYLEGSSYMTQEDIEYLSKEAADRATCDKLLKPYTDLFKKAMSQYE